MKTKICIGLFCLAAFGLLVSNARADEPVAGGIAAATQSAPVVSNGCPECSECAGLGIGGRFGGGLIGRGIGAPGMGLPQPGFIDQINETIANDRPIVEASPFGNPNGHDWSRFRYYPYGYYPHNFNSYPNMNVPKYHPGYQNYYPVPRRYHAGNHFNLDVMK